MDSQEHDAIDEDSLTSDMVWYDDYWKFIENPIHHMSREGSSYSESFGGFIENPIYDMFAEGSVHLETWESLDMEEEHSKFSYGHSESYHPKSYPSINNKYFERKSIEEFDLIQSMEGHPEPTFFHSEVPYDLEQPRVYTESYQSISPFDICDGLIDLLHHTDMNISPIQTWIEEAHTGVSRKQASRVVAEEGGCFHAT